MNKRPRIIMSTSIELLTLSAVMAYSVIAWSSESNQPATEITNGSDNSSGVELSDKSEADKKKNVAVNRLKKLGGKVRFFYKPDNPDHWIQIILDSRQFQTQSLEKKLTGAIAKTLVGPFDDSAMLAVRYLALDAPVNLHLINTRVTPEGLRRLSKTKIRKLAIEGDNTIDLSLRKLKHLPELKILSIAGPSLTDDGLISLIECKQLESLGISGKQFTEHGLSHIAKLQNLKELSLGDGIGDEAAVLVNQLEKLENLSVSAGVSGEFFDRQINLQSLRSLSITGDNINDKTILDLCKNAQHLSSLYIRRANVKDEGVKYISRLKSLSVLCFDGSPISDLGIEHLKGMQHLRWLDLSETEVTDKSLAVIGTIKPIRQLFLMNTKITDAGLNHLRELENLLHLDLQATKVTTIPEWLKEKPRLYVSH